MSRRGEQGIDVALLTLNGMSASLLVGLSSSGASTKTPMHTMTSATRIFFFFGVRFARNPFFCGSLEPVAGRKVNAGAIVLALICLSYYLFGLPH